MARAMETLTVMSEDLCVHCHERLKVKPGGLCRRCYNIKELRDQYRLQCERGKHRGLGLENRDPKRLPCPTNARPGTAEKIRVLASRLEQGYTLWHPLDAPLDTDELNYRDVVEGHYQESTNGEVTDLE